MFFSIKKKHIKIISIGLLVAIFLLTLYNTTPTHLVTSSYLDELTRNLYDSGPQNAVQPYIDPEVDFNKKVKSLYYKKLVNDIDNNYWLINTKLEDTKLEIPSYYKPVSDGKASGEDLPVKPLIQPFDPRFTLGVYINYIRQEMKENKDVSIPFHWYDWKDMSVLNKHLLSLESSKLNCSFLDSVADENKWLDEKDRKKAEEDAKLKKLEDERLEKERKMKDEELARMKEAAEALAKEQETLKNELKNQVEQELIKDFNAKISNLQAELIKHKGNPKELAKIIEKLEIVENQKNEKTQELNDQINKDDDNEEKNSNDDNDDKKDNNVSDEKKVEDQKSKDDKKNDEDNKKKEKRENNHDDLDSITSGFSSRDDNEKSRKNEAKSSSQFCYANSEVPEGFNDGNVVRPGFNVFDNPGKTTRERSILIGTSYLYFAAPPPDQIVFLTNDGSYKVGTSSRQKLLDNGLVEDFMKKTGSKSVDVAKEFRKLQKQHKPESKDVISDYEIKIPEESFTFDHEKIAKDFEKRLLTEGEELSTMETKYYRSLLASQEAVKTKTVSKYFEESRIIGTTLGDHYDWRFTNGIHYGAYEQTLVLHRLVRTWLSFCRKNGITTWVAHGSLLSWYWNGIAFPWDNDIDVQVPIMDLHKLSMDFNQTLVIEDAEDGFGRYFLDCGTFITLRERGNGLNNIDARFIDVDTGLYIDITGLAISNSGAPKRYKEAYLPEGWIEEEHNRTNTNMFLKAYNCRNNHFSLYNELSPLIKTVVEGEIGYVPRKYSEILKVEYSKGLLSKKFSHHIFIPQLRLWVPHDDIYFFLQDKDKWLEINTFAETYKDSEDDDPDKFNLQYALSEEEKKAFKKEKSGLSDDDLATVLELTLDDMLKFLNKDEIFIAYFNTHEFTHFHEEEIMRLLYGKSASKLLDSAPDFPPMKYEPFMYKMHSNYLTYEKQVERYLAMMDSYEGGK